MKRNVLHLIGTLEIGGTECQAVQLAGLLKKDATYQVFIACLDGNGPLRADVERITGDSIPEFPLTSFYDVNFWSQIRRCVSYLKKREIGIIHTHDFYTNIFGMMSGFMAGVPVRIASKRNTFSKTRNQMLVERQAFRLADRIVVNGDAVKTSLVAKGVSENKIVLVTNGIDLDSYRSVGDIDRTDRLRHLGLEGTAGNKIVAIVANLRSDVKNHSMFLRTAERVRSKYPNVDFVVAGEGELLERLRSDAAERGLAPCIHFIGRCNAVPTLLSVSDVCMLTSRSEGFPNSILEYMAAGKPVVATDVGAVAEVVMDGKSGFLVASDDDAAAASRVVTLLENPVTAAALGKHGHEVVAAHYSKSAQLKKVLDLYDDLLRVKRRIKVGERI